MEKLKPKVYGITGNGSLAIGSPNLTKDQVDAHGHLIAWVQDVAEGIVKQDPETWGDPSNWEAEMKSQGWFDAWVNGVVNYTKFVTIKSDQNASSSKHSSKGSVKIGELLDAAIKIYFGVEALATYETMNDLLGNPSVDVTNFMNFWWSHVKKTKTNTGVKFGPAIPVDGGDAVEFTAIFYSVTESVDDWRALFIESVNEDVDIFTVGLTFQYSNDDWKKFGPEIMKQLSPDIKKSIHNAPLGG
ncbi:hypothetical protein [Sediminibacter sp. Hel_I_10]|uniref:hypothetical protein n=1 Tax=Sediminibacter sp. Hel_I_10 TaxID=1392490 RepID=UPI00047A5959|nr:hypothetical protein [Sediminibacter sp. Hel_I_10]